MTDQTNSPDTSNPTSPGSQPSPQGSSNTKSGPSNSEQPPVDLGNVNNVANIIEDAAKLASELQDYISYSTLLSVHLSDPGIYTEDERLILLNRLLKVLSNDHVLLYHIGWDLPDLLIRYLLSSFDFETGPIRYILSIKPITAIFTLLAEKGNTKEVNLKALDTLEHLTVESNYNAVWKLANKDVQYEGTDPDSYHLLDAARLSKDEYDNRVRIAERYFDIKFLALFELISNTTSTVKTSYPSRFLASTTSGLLSFFANNAKRLSYHGLIFIARRLYLFPRDYTLLLSENEQDSSISENEVKIQAKLLQSYITFLYQLMFLGTSAKWATRLYLELRHGVAAEPDQLKRERFYALNGYTATMEDLATRVEQLGYSFDLELIPLFKNVVKDYICSYNKRVGNIQEEDTVSETSTIRSDALPFDFQGAKLPDNVHLSKEGIVLLATQLRCTNRKNKDIPEFSSFADLMKVTAEIVLGGESDINIGMIDALCFWALWAIRNIKNRDQFNKQVSDEKLVIEYLQCLTLLSSKAFRDDQLAQLIYSVINRILALQTPQFRYNYLIDTIESCPFPMASEVAIKSLKELLASPSRSIPPNENQNGKRSDVESITSSLSNIKISKSLPPTFQLSESQNSKITRLIFSVIDSASTAIETLKRQNGEEVGLISSSDDDTENEDELRESKDYPKSVSGSTSSSVDFGLLIVWANFLSSSPLSRESTNKLTKKYKTLVKELNSMYKNGQDSDENKNIAENGSEINRFLKQTQLLQSLVDRIGVN